MTKSLYGTFVASIEFEINKHGQAGGHETVEDYVNSMQPYEFLEKLSDSLEAMGIGGDRE